MALVLVRGGTGSVVAMRVLAAAEVEEDVEVAVDVMADAVTLVHQCQGW